MKRIGEDVAEKLDYQPGVFTVERHVRGKWVTNHGSQVGEQHLVRSPPEFMQRPAAHGAKPPAGHREPMARALRERLLSGDQFRVVKVAEGSAAGLREIHLVAADLSVDPARHRQRVRHVRSVQVIQSARNSPRR